jgi:hypothetical protein
MPPTAVAACLTSQRWRTRRPHPAPATRAADVGPAADAFAAAYIDAEVLLLAQNETPEETLHAAWSQVGYLATQWADLVTAVVDGQPCPPPGQC